MARKPRRVPRTGLRRLRARCRVDAALQADELTAGRCQHRSPAHGRGPARSNMSGRGHGKGNTSETHTRQQLTSRQPVVCALGRSGGPVRGSRVAAAHRREHPRVSVKNTPRGCRRYALPRRGVDHEPLRPYRCGGTR